MEEASFLSPACILFSDPRLGLRSRRTTSRAWVTQSTSFPLAATLATVSSLAARSLARPCVLPCGSDRGSPRLRRLLPPLPPPSPEFARAMTPWLARTTIGGASAQAGAGAGAEAGAKTGTRVGPEVPGLARERSQLNGVAAGVDHNQKQDHNAANSPVSSCRKRFLAHSGVCSPCSSLPPLCFLSRSLAPLCRSLVVPCAHW